MNDPTMRRQQDSREALMRTLAALALAGLIPSYASAQAPDLVGTWRLKSVTDERTGRPDESWGSNPKGILILDGTGHFSQHQMRSDRPKYAGRGRLDGTSDDHKRAAEHTLSYFGNYSVDPEKKVITFRYEGSSWPNLEGTCGSVGGSDITLVATAEVAARPCPLHAGGAGDGVG